MDYMRFFSFYFSLRALCSFLKGMFKVVTLPIIPGIGSQRQEDQEFEASFEAKVVVRPCLKNKRAGA
jgi:hypothetical protein